MKQSKLEKCMNYFVYCSGHECINVIEFDDVDSIGKIIKCDDCGCVFEVVE